LAGSWGGGVDGEFCLFESFEAFAQLLILLLQLPDLFDELIDRWGVGLGCGARGKNCCQKN